MLWLCDNEITVVDNLQALFNLEELNLARNAITHVGDSLLANTCLTSINLSDNLIANFNDVATLAKLPKLEDLYYSDPHWGDNPINCLGNYQTYVIFMVPALKSLDSIPLSKEMKSRAASTYREKELYYNVKTQTFYRNVNDVLKVGSEGRESLINIIEHMIGVLLRQSKETEKVLQRCRHTSNTSSYFPGVDLLTEMHFRLTNAINRLVRKVGVIRTQYNRCKSKVCAEYDSHAKRTKVELASGGNVRIEVCTPTDSWYAPCADFVYSRFFVEDYSNVPVDILPTDVYISGIQVNGVLRVHNRYLRNRFELRLPPLQDKVDLDDTLEYVMIGECPELPGELHNCMEHGFRSPIEHTLERAGLLTLCDSLSLADLPRLLAVKPTSCSGTSGDLQVTCGSCVSGVSFTYGDRFADIWSDISQSEVLIAKVYLGRQIRLSGVRQNLLNSLPGAYPGYDSVYWCQSKRNNNRAWYIFDQSLILPEFLVKFEYKVTYKDTIVKHHLGKFGNYSEIGQLGRQSGTCLSLIKKTLTELRGNVRLVTRPIMLFLEACARESSILQAPLHCDTRDNLLSQWVFPRTLNATGILHKLDTSNSGMINMTESVILTYLGARRSSVNVTHINLSSNRIQKIEGLHTCPFLEALVMPFNELSKIEGIDNLKHLRLLDLGHNLIKRIDGLNGIPNLKVLELNNNLLFRLEDLNTLRKCTPRLDTLNLRCNAICENKAYNGLVLRRLRALHHLDGLPVMDIDLLSALKSTSVLTPLLILQNAKFHHRVASKTGSWCSRSAVLDAVRSSTQDYAGTSEFDLQTGTQCKNSRNLILEDMKDWGGEVQEVVLEHQCLRRIQNLEQLTSMRRASFRDNAISCIEGLRHCTALEELSLEENDITTIDGLQYLFSLKVLNLSNNRISQIENLSPYVPQLTQLSLEGNAITNLRGLSGLNSIIELYLSNNMIEELREVQQLRHLQKLVVLDLGGNPVSEELDYRCYVVYNLPHIKVFDGIVVDPAERSVAKDRYAGMLTRDVLEHKSGRQNFYGLHHLDLFNMRIRNIGSTFITSEFDCLREINLDSNQVEDICMLAELPNLTVLRLKRNRLEDRPLWSTLFKNRTSQGLQTEISNHLRKQVVLGLPRCDASVSKGDFIQLSEVSMRRPFPSLNTIYLGSNSIKSLLYLRLDVISLTLRELFIEDNAISRLHGINVLTNLEKLVLDRNRIKVLDPQSLTGLVHLRELHINQNGLKSLSHLSPLVRLSSLHLNGNRVAELSEVEKLAVHPQLHELTLISNPVTRKQVYRPMCIRHCRGLLALDGDIISFEERDHVDYLFSPLDAVTVQTAVTCFTPISH